MLQDRFEVDVCELEFDATVVATLPARVTVFAEMALIVIEEFKPCEV